MKKPPIVYSGGCSQLHGPNNMGRSFIENNAAVAYIGTTDIGFYNITRVWNDESDFLSRSPKANRALQMKQSHHQ